MAKIKKKELEERLRLEIADVKRSRVEWDKLYENDPTLKDKATQMAYMDGMIYAYEHLMYVYGMKRDLAD